MTHSRKLGKTLGIGFLEQRGYVERIDLILKQRIISIVSEEEALLAPRGDSYHQRTLVGILKH